QVKGANREITMLNLVVRPLTKFDSARGLILVLFEDVTLKVHTATPPTGEDQKIARMERELRATEEYFQTAIDELETSSEELKSANEELQSTNEELQSTNEELQSTNEELETSEQELQSVNEELMTVNTELQKKIEELSQSNNDMTNLLSATGIGTVFVDNHLHIQRFTPAVTQVIDLIGSDIGRRLGDISSAFPDNDRLDEDVRTVLDTLVPKEMEVRTREGLW